MKMRSVATHFFGFGSVALYGLDLGEGLVGGASRLGDPILHTGARLSQSASEDEGGSNDDWHYGQSRRREAAVGDREENDSANQEQRLPRKLGEIVAENGLQHGRVGRKPAGVLSSPPLGEKSRRQPDEMREQIFAQLGDDKFGGRRQQIDLHEVEQCLDGEENQQTQRDLIEEPRVGGDERGVEQMTNDLWERQCDAGARQQAHEGDQQSPQVRSDPREQTSEGPRRRNRLIGARRRTLR